MTRRLRYSLRFFLLATFGIAVVLAVVSRELKRLRFESGFDFSSGSPTLVFACRTEEDARHVAAEFDDEYFRDLVIEAWRREEKDPERSRHTVPFHICGGCAGSVFFVKYDFARAAHYRFDVLQMQYVIDSGDKESETQDAMVHHVFQQAGKMFAQSNPAILELMHDP